MTKSNELKVGDVVSYLLVKDRWICGTIAKADKGMAACMYHTSDKYFFIYRDDENISWQRGIHHSLIPEGFILFEKCSLETTNEQLDFYIKERARLIEELEAARKDSKRLDFLADVSQFIANVQLPTDIVESNLTSLRDAIDAAELRWNSRNKSPKPEDK